MDYIIEGKTISFPKGKGSLRHNNRDFIADNVDRKRMDWNRTYIKEDITVAYEKCFGESLRTYNAKQKRKDRQKKDYISEIRNSDNGEKVFYENVVQIGTKDNTGVVDENGNLTMDAKVAVEILEEYAKTFQSRNPNLYLFNCVLHMDEATPHLHMDYIPVASGYKNGMETRNSLTKALQQMGFAKAVSKTKNETVAWQERERGYIKQLCMERGIEIVEKGEHRENYSVAEYKEAMRAVENLETQAENLSIENSVLESRNEMLETCIQKMEIKHADLQKQEEKLEKQIHKYALQADIIKEVEKEIKAEIKKTKAEAVTVKGIWDKEEHIKVPKRIWNKMLQAYQWAVSRQKLIGQYEVKITKLEDSNERLRKFADKYKTFINAEGLDAKFEAFLQPKSIRRLLREKREEIRAAEAQKAREGFVDYTENTKKKRYQMEI